MSKRAADREIKRDNLADEKEDEEVGKKPKRGRTNVEEPASIFSGFSFTKSNVNEENLAKTNLLSGIFGNGTSTSLLSKEVTQSKNTSESSAEITNTNKKDVEFYSQIKGLNESVASWIQNHVNADPLCILTPIFKDYENYLKDIKAKREKMEKEDNNVASDKISPENISTPSPSVSKEPFQAQAPSSIFGAKPAAKDELKTEEPKKSPMVFNTGSATFSFGNSSTSPQSSLPTAGFSFGTGAPFTFGNVANPCLNTETISKPNVEEEPDEDAPPKVEFKAVIEEDSVYTIRCKVFVKKNNTYVDGGVGNLFLKPIKDMNKTQLIVRADTNLGNLLMNVLLSESIPTQRMGKNNVMIVCIPTPEKGPMPSSILLRVKTAEQADELLEMINKYKC